MRPKYNHEISLGQIGMIISFLVSVGLMQLPRGSDVAVAMKDINRHELIIDKLVMNQESMSASLHVLTRLLDDHLEDDRVVHRVQGVQQERKDPPAPTKGKPVTKLPLRSPK